MATANSKESEQNCFMRMILGATEEAPLARRIPAARKLPWI
jgi:hypothetical protein